MKFSFFLIPILSILVIVGIIFGISIFYIYLLSCLVLLIGILLFPHKFQSEFKEGFLILPLLIAFLFSVANLLLFREFSFALVSINILLGIFGGVLHFKNHQKNKTA